MQQVPATRQELLLLKKKIKSTSKGRDLLKDKRDGLIKLFMEVIDEAILLRNDVENVFADVIEQYGLGESRIDLEYIKALVNNTESSITLTTRYIYKMGVKIPEVTPTLVSESMNYSTRLTNGDFDESLDKIRHLMPKLIVLLEKEQRVRLLADEITKTRRRVNALDYVVIPRLIQKRKDVGQKLEEQSRVMTMSLMRLKSMMG